MTQWKQIEGFEKYLVSDNGTVVNKRTGRTLKPKITYDGYCEVRLYVTNTIEGSKFIRIHRLVANAFVPNPNNLETIDHINGIKTDNRAENLRWLNRSDNLKRFWEEQITEEQRARYEAQKKPIKCLENGIVYESVTQAGKALGINRTSIVGNLSGRRQYIHGLHFVYVKENSKC